MHQTNSELFTAIIRELIILGLYSGMCGLCTDDVTTLVAYIDTLALCVSCLVFAFTELLSSRLLIITPQGAKPRRGAS